MPTSSVRVIFTGDSSGATRAVRGLERGFGGLNRVAGVAAKALAVGVVGGLVAATKAAISFDKEMRNVNSIAKLSEREFQKLSKDVRGLSKETAKAPSDLARGMYDLVSSGFDANESIKVLRVSAKAATAGLTDTATATKAVAAALNAYHLGADDARKVSDILFQTVNKGVLTFEELAQNMGDLVPAAAPLGVSLEEVGAAIATITLQGVPAAEAATRVKNTMLQLASPSKALSGLLKDNGFQSGEAAIKARGFVGVLELLQKATGGNVTETSKLTPEIRALLGVVGLTGKNLETYQRNLRAMENAQKGAGATAGAFAEQGKSISFQWQKAKAALAAAAIPLGQLLFPALVKGAEATSAFAEGISRNMPEIKRQFGEVAGAVESFGRIAFTVASTDLGQAGLLGALTAITTLNVTGKILAMGAAFGGLAVPMGIAAGALGILAGGYIYFALQADGATEALDRFHEALLAQDDASRALERGHLRIKQSETNVKGVRQALARETKGLADIERDYGRKSEEANAARLRVEQLENALAAAVLEHKDSLRDLPGLQRAAGDAAKDAQEKARDAYDSTARKIETYSALTEISEEHTRGLNEALGVYGGKLHKIDKDLGTAEGTTRQYVDAVKALYDELGKLPSRKDVQIYITQTYRTVGQKATRGITPGVGRAGGGFIPMVPGASRGTDSVPAMLTPGEIVLNRSQQNALGGPRFLADLFGFTGAEGPGFQTGGIVGGVGSGVGVGRSRPLRGRPYGRVSKAARSALVAVERVNQAETNLDRAYGQLQREYGISVEEFIVSVTGPDGTESEVLDESAVAKHVAEIDSLIAHRNRMLGLLDQERAKLEAAIAALRDAVAALVQAMRAEEREAEGDAARIRHLAGQLRSSERAEELLRREPDPKTDAGRKARDRELDRFDDEQDSLRKLSERAEGSRRKHLEKRGTLGSQAQEFREALGIARGVLTNELGFDRRDVSLDVTELRRQRSNVLSIRPRVNPPVVPFVGGGDSSGLGIIGGAGDSGDLDALRRQVEELTRRLGLTTLALGVEGRQLGVIRGFQKGTLHVNTDQLAFVHAGERITPAGVGGGTDSTINLTVELHGSVSALDPYVDARVDRGVVRNVEVISEKIGRKADFRARGGMEST